MPRQPARLERLLAERTNNKLKPAPPVNLCLDDDNVVNGAEGSLTPARAAHQVVRIGARCCPAPSRSTCLFGSVLPQPAADQKCCDFSGRKPVCYRPINGGGVLLAVVRNNPSRDCVDYPFRGTIDVYVVAIDTEPWLHVSLPSIGGHTVLHPKTKRAGDTPARTTLHP